MPLFRSPAAVAAVPLLLLLPTAVAGQTGPGGHEPVTASAPSILEPRSGEDALTAADRILAEGRPLEALDLLEARLASDPSDGEARWRAARAAVTLGILAPTEADEERWLERGIAHGERAVDALPDDPDALYWLVSARGWLAMVVGSPRRIAGLADAVLADATRLLELEPDHPGGHHALGKLHFEVMTLSGFERFLARWILGVDVAAVSSWDRSVDHLSRAVTLDPGMLLYRLDLGMTYDRTDRPDRARAELRAALALPDREPVDPLFRRRARALLDALEADALEPARTALDAGGGR